MEQLNNMEFSTFDADHDNLHSYYVQHNCAVYYGGGFWWNDCGYQNVNGHYSGNNYNKWQKIWWGNHYNLKKTQFMIRPAAEN